MKKFASIILAAVLLATMLTVFAVPASAETKTAGDYMEEAEEYANNGQDEDAANAYTKAGECYEKANVFYMAGDAFYKAGARYNDAGDYASSAYAYMKAGECYLKDGNFFDAGTCFSNAAQAAQRKANDSTGSVLSEGSLTIIVGIAAAVVFGLGGFILGTKKKKKNEE